MKKLLSYSLKIGLTLIVLYFVGRQVVQHWEQVEQADWQFDWLYLILSLVCAHIGLFIFAASWGVVARAFGHAIAAPMSYKIFNLSNLGRYVPGKVWQVFGMIYLAKKAGMPGERAAASFVIVQPFAIAASLLVYFLTVQVESSLLIDNFSFAGQGTAYLLGGLCALGCAVLVLFPEPFLRLMNYVLKRMGRETASFDLKKSVALLVFMGYFCGWIFSGLAYWLLLKSVLGSGAPSAIASIGLYNIAYQIGYLAVFAPGGFGPRELVMGELLKPFVGPIGPAVAVLARLWSVLVDATAATIALCIKK